MFLYCVPIVFLVSMPGNIPILAFNMHAPGIYRVTG